MSLHPILNLQQIQLEIEQRCDSFIRLRQLLKQIQTQLDDAFLSGVKARELIRLRSNVLDCFLKITWKSQQLEQASGLCLTAVGGYGREQYKDNLFATTTAVLDRLQLNIMEARIITSKHGYSLDTYTLLCKNIGQVFSVLSASWIF